MNVLEKEIEDLIWHGITKDRSLLCRKGLLIPDSCHYFRQPNLGSYGFADIAGFNIGVRSFGYRDIFIHVLEIKKDEVNIETLTQALRYCNAIRRTIEAHLKYCRVDYRIDLIGRTIETRSDFAYISSVIYNINLYTYNIDFSTGIKFELHRDYFQTNESLPDIKQFSGSFVEKVKQLITGDVELPF